MSSTIYGQDNFQPIPPQPLSYDELILTVSTNKQSYLPGETILITGNLFNGSKPLDTPLDLFVSNSSQITVYGTMIKVVNGSFTSSAFSAPQKLGVYTIEVLPHRSLNIYTHALVEVENPVFAKQYLMVYLAFGSFVGLIFIILRAGTMNFATSEILRFVFITGIVASPIVGLLFSDSELGINSPISLITKPDSGKGKSDMGTIWKNQWFIAVGGLKIDSYMSGILIPFYVIIFGIAGGYLRYLYTTSIKIWHLDTPSDAVSSNVKSVLFSWNKIPEDLKQLEKFKSFLLNSFDADWIKEGSIKNVDGKLITTSADQTKSITIEPNESYNIASIKVGNVFFGTLRLERQPSGDLYVYQIMERRVWSFFQSLADLALLLLSPLLAIAAWFILTRGGDIDKYIVALVSFTVGLATNTIISNLTDFTVQKIKTQTESG